MANLYDLVYFIHCPEADMVKIGCTLKNPNERLDSLQTGCPYELVRAGVIHARFMSETAVHAKFKASRVRREWFKLTPDLLEFMEEHLEPWPDEAAFQEILEERREKQRQAPVEFANRLRAYMRPLLEYREAKEQRKKEKSGRGNGIF
jgi:Meiotically up-regulated gene 113